ncbi:MAG: hypothetical protein QMC74_02885, partial [Myxococcota bacterium]
RRSLIERRGPIECRGLRAMSVVAFRVHQDSRRVRFTSSDDPLLWVVVSVEHDEPSPSRFLAAAFAKVADGAGWLSPPEDDCVSFDASRDRGFDPTRPALENVAIPRPLDVKNESRGCLWQRSGL